MCIRDSQTVATSSPRRPAMSSDSAWPKHPVGQPTTARPHRRSRSRSPDERASQAVNPSMRRIVDATRRQLRDTAAQRPRLRRVLEIAEHELKAALDHDVYSGAYFGEGRNPADRAYLSGYERYDRETSNANVAAYLAWVTFPAATSLDIGCATGFVVEALRELGVDARG